MDLDNTSDSGRAGPEELVPSRYALGIGDIAASTGLTKAGGYLGLMTAAAGAYLAMAELTNATFGRKVLPIHPLS